ncbi:MAG: hypothetical protein IT458_11575 [Planctomycetes bacterium]|nr:hypothetical protein [Planctomycetota bacterium]
MSATLALLLVLLVPQDPPTRAASQPASRPTRGAGGWQLDADAWQRPPRIAWQRSYADALAVARAEGRPLLLVVNMDGEPASESFAGGRYRDPAFAALVARYVPVIASLQRHTPRDHDEQGARIPCPRFGTVTCGEHIAAEAVLFPRYFQANPVAPRHLAVGTDGSVLFDRFLDSDLTRVDEALQAHAAAPPPERDPASLDTQALAAARDARARSELERRYVQGDGATRGALLAAVAAARGSQPDLLRLALRDRDADVRAAAVRTLAAGEDAAQVPLILEALDQDLPAAQRLLLLDGLARLGAADPTARILARSLRALAGEPEGFDARAWLETHAAALRAPAEPAPRSQEDVEAALDKVERALATGPKDATLRAQQAALTLELAELRAAAGRPAELFFADALRLAREALDLGAPRAPTAAVQARAALAVGDLEAAAVAWQALPWVQGQEPGRPEVAAVFRALAQGRIHQVDAAVRAERDWDPLWLAQAHAALRVLAVHPSGGAEDVRRHVDLLERFGARADARRALRAGLARFPVHPALHDLLRQQELASGGPDALEAAYASLAEGHPDPASLAWFQGYATLMAAEAHERGGDPARAFAACERALRAFARRAAGNPANDESVRHYRALLLAAQAGIRLGQGETEGAVDLICEAIRTAPASMESANGLGITPAQVAARVRARAEADARAALDRVLREHAPDLRLPAPGLRQPGR